MASADQITYWNNEGGARWTAAAARLAIIFEPLTRVLMRLASPKAGEWVLDVGCGTGSTVIELARCVGPQGRVVGLDVSRIILDVAKEALAAATIANAELILADAATHDFGAGKFDLLFSQFGVMFFSDPLAAFSSLRRALKKDGRVAFACWREMQANPWFWVPLEAVRPFAPPPEPVPPGAPGPLAFADPQRVKRILSEAGFREICMLRHDAELPVGDSSGLDAAANYMANIGPAGRLLADVDPKSKARAVTAIKTALESYTSSDGIRLAGSIWLVSARNG